MSKRRFTEAIVLGGGPAGLVAALQASTRVSTTLVVRHLPCARAAPRVDVVPASLLTLLVEFGIHPTQVCVRQLHESRWIAWERDTPVEIRCFAEAHVERPPLELALMNCVVASKRIRLVVGDRALEQAALMGPPGVRVIDATGRAAVSARRRVVPLKPWAARTFWTDVPGGHTAGAFRIAALPGGFVYAVGSARHRIVGVVGWRDTIVGDCGTLAGRIRDARAAWVLDGLPPLAALNAGTVSPASVQWSEGSNALAIGDAALARDILSSQGLVAGMSDGLFAAASDSDDDDARLSSRKLEQRVAHLTALERLLTTSRFAHDANWSGYASFVHAHLADPPTSTIALREGRLVDIGSLHSSP